MVATKNKAARKLTTSNHLTSDGSTYSATKTPSGEATKTPSGEATKTQSTRQPGASPDEVERMMRNLCAYALSEPDPLQRYQSLTHQQAVFAGVSSALALERGRALADVADAGTPLERIVQDAGLSTPQQVRSLVKAAGRALPRPKKRSAAEQRVAEQLAEEQAAEQRAAEEQAAEEQAAEEQAAEQRAAEEAATAAKNADVKSKTPAPMLPMTALPTGSRVLTPEERVALGLPASGLLGSLPRQRAGSRA